MQERKYSWGAKAKNENSKDMLLQMIEEMEKNDSKNNINVDIADVQMVLDYTGIYDVQVSEQIGSNSTTRAIEDVVEGITPINKLNSALLLIELPVVYKMIEIVNLIDEHIYSLGDDDTTVIFGTTENKSFRETQIKVTLLINMLEFD